MPRPRKGAVVLPAGVHSVKARGKVYHYWQPGRGSAGQTKRIRIPYEEHDPRFWQFINDLQGPGVGTVSALIIGFKAGPDYARYTKASKRHCDHYLARIEREGVERKNDTLVMVVQGTF